MIDSLSSYLWPWQMEILDVLKRPENKTIVKKHRQSGATEASCWLACFQALLVPNHKIWCISQKQKSSVSQYIDRIKNRMLPVLKGWKPEFFSKTQTTRAEIRFPNGSVIAASSNNIEGLRGETKCSLICDEFAKWDRQAQESFDEALEPIIDSKQNKHGFLLVVSTPWTRQDNKYSDIWHDEEKYPDWYRISYDVYDDIEIQANWTEERFLEKKKAKDPSYIAREYEGAFSAESIAYYPDLFSMRSESVPKSFERLVLGIDVGGISDPTCAVLVGLEKGTNTKHVLDVLYVKTSDFEQQCLHIKDFFEDDLENIQKATVDKTAHGSFPTLLKQHFDFSIKGRSFTRKWKKKHAEDIRKDIEAKDLRLFINNERKVSNTQEMDAGIQYLEEDLASIRQVHTRSGNITYKSQRMNGRHGDGWAALLCAYDALETGFYIAGTF